MLRTLRTQVKWILVFFLLCFVLAIPLMYGVGRRGSKGDAGQGDYAVAEIDGAKLMRSHLVRMVRNYVDQAGIREVTSTDLPGIRQAVLDQMVTRTALEKEAKALGITPAKSDLDHAVAEIADQFPTKEAFQQYLQQTGMSMKELEKQLRTQLAQRMLLEEASASAVVTDEELHELYDSVKDFVFTKPAGVQVLAAEFTTKDVAEQAYEDLISGTSWDVVMARVSSDDLKGKTSSDAPALLRDGVLTGNLAFVVSMDDGQYAEPVEISSDDFLVLYRKGVKEKEVTPFDQAKEQLQSMVLSQKKQELQRQYVEKLSDKISVTILDSALFPEKKAPVSQDKTPEVISADNESQPTSDASADKDSRDNDKALEPASSDS
ncbi:MAG: hypothetical protein CSA35_08570 [Dethiosulfovibrio peptidovorans]|nr:MAG: hypothetical protein CSA35_08570 [Dethiosulfovibrio peptidovorans]